MQYLIRALVICRQQVWMKYMDSKIPFPFNIFVNFVHWLIIFPTKHNDLINDCQREHSPRGEFSISTRVAKNWFHTWVSTRDKVNLFCFISARGENIFAKNCGIFYKNVLRKKMFRMQLQDYIKPMMLYFINKRSKMFNFKIFGIVLLATINSKIVTASLCWTCIAATKDLWSKKTTRNSWKRCNDFEEYCLWKGQRTKQEVCKKSSTFSALKQFI